MYCVQIILSNTFGKLFENVQNLMLGCFKEIIDFYVMVTLNISRIRLAPVLLTFTTISFAILELYEVYSRCKY